MIEYTLPGRNSISFLEAPAALKPELVDRLDESVFGNKLQITRGLITRPATIDRLRLTVGTKASSPRLISAYYDIRRAGGAMLMSPLEEFTLFSVFNGKLSYRAIARLTNEDEKKWKRRAMQGLAKIRAETDIRSVPPVQGKALALVRQLTNNDYERLPPIVGDEAASLLKAVLVDHIPYIQIARERGIKHDAAIAQRFARAVKMLEAACSRKVRPSRKQDPSPVDLKQNKGNEATAEPNSRSTSSRLEELWRKFCLRPKKEQKTILSLSEARILSGRLLFRQSHEDIAAELGTPVSAVLHTMQRGSLKLRIRFAPVAISTREQRLDLLERYLSGTLKVSLTDTEDRLVRQHVIERIPLVELSRREGANSDWASGRLLAICLKIAEANTSNPDKELLESYLKQMADGARPRLKKIYLEVVEPRLKGVPFSQIAAELNIRPITARQRYKMACQSIRALSDLDIAHFSLVKAYFDYRRAGGPILISENGETACRLRYIENLQPHEIGPTLGSSRQAVIKLLQRSLDKLDKLQSLFWTDNKTSSSSSDTSNTGKL